jgi:uncharacterized membrane protein YwaF
MLLTPVVFGSKHLIGTSLMIILIAAFLILSLKVYKGKPRTIMIIATFTLIGLELFKYLFVLYERNALPEHMMPLQLCSFSLYAMPIVTFAKEKTAKFVMPFAYAVGLVSGLIVLIFPANVLGSSTNWFPVNGDLLPFQSFLYHATMVFFSLYIVLAKVYQPKLSDVKRAFFILLGVALVAFNVNLLLETDFMLLRVGNGNPLNFLIDTSYSLYLISLILLGFILLSLTFLPFYKKHA